MPQPWSSNGGNISESRTDIYSVIFEIELRVKKADGSVLVLFTHSSPRRERPHGGAGRRAEP